MKIEQPDNLTLNKTKYEFYTDFRSSFKTDTGSVEELAT